MVGYSIHLQVLRCKPHPPAKAMGAFIFCPIQYNTESYPVLCSPDACAPPWFPDPGDDYFHLFHPFKSFQWRHRRWVSKDILDGQVQTSPWLSAKDGPFQAFVNSSSASMMSLKIYWVIYLPVPGFGIMFLGHVHDELAGGCLSGKAILLMRGLDANGLPASTPKPLTAMLSTPAGRMSSMISANTMMPGCLLCKRYNPGTCCQA